MTPDPEICFDSLQLKQLKSIRRCIYAHLCLGLNAIAKITNCTIFVGVLQNFTLNDSSQSLIFRHLLVLHMIFCNLGFLVTLLCYSIITGVCPEIYSSFWGLVASKQ